MPSPARQASRPRDPTLDGLRGFAILLVFLFHYGGGLRAHNPVLRTLGYLTQAGWIGVELFFALSGFLITNLLTEALLRPGPASRTVKRTESFPHNDVSHTLPNFYVRRALRILPLYFAALLACAGAALRSGSHLRQLEPLLIYAGFLQNLPPYVETALHTPPPLPVFHLWSLAVEEQFYLLWPFLLLLARTPRRALYLSVCTFSLSAVVRAFVFNPHFLSFAAAQTYATFLPLRAGSLALGAAYALFLQQTGADAGSLDGSVLKSAFSRSQQAARSADSVSPAGLPVAVSEAPVIRSASAKGTTQSYGPALTCLVALALILLTTVHTHTLLLNNRMAYILTLPAASLLATALLALIFQPNIIRNTLSTALLRFLGRISYGFYIFHILLEPVVDHLGAAWTHTQSGFAYQTARLLIAFPLATAVATLSYYLLERPFLRLKQRFPRTIFVRAAQQGPITEVQT